MKVVDLFVRSIDSLASARSRTVLTTLSIGVASFSLAIAISINNGGGAYVQNIIDANTEDQSLWVLRKLDKDSTTFRPGKYTGNPPLIFNYAYVQPLTQKDIDTIRETPGVKSADPAIIIDDGYFTRPGQENYQLSVTSQRSNDGGFLQAGSIDNLRDDEVILPDGFREALQYVTPDEAIGTTITIHIRNSSNMKVTTKAFPLRVVAVVKESRNILRASSLRVTQNVIEKMYDYATKGTPMQGLYLGASAKIVSMDDIERTKQLLMNKGFEAQTKLDRDKGLTGFVMVFQLVLLIFGVLSIITAVFGVINTQYMSVLQRVHVIGLMKALGMQKRDVAMLFRIEAAVIGFFGATVGVSFAALSAFMLNPIFVQTSGLDPNTEILSASPFNLIIIVIVLTIVATVAGLVPAKKASQLDPIDALRDETE